MRQALIDHKPPRETKHRTITERPNGLQEQLETLRTKMRNHPCHGCSERETHARWAERWYKLNSDTDGLRRQIARRTNTIAHVFNRIAQLLTSYGYVNRATDGELTLTSTGQSLRRIYGDKDLLTCLCLEAGFLNTLDPAPSPQPSPPSPTKENATPSNTCPATPPLPTRKHHHHKP